MKFVCNQSLEFQETNVFVGHVGGKAKSQTKEMRFFSTNMAANMAAVMYPVSFIYIYIYIKWDLPVTDRAKNEAKYGGHGGCKLRRFQSPCAIFTIYTRKHERPRRDWDWRKLVPPLAAMFRFTRWPEDLTPDIYRAHWM